MKAADTMAKIDVKCPHCEETKVVTHGKNANGIRRYRCTNDNCACKTFMLDYAYNGWKPGIEEAIVEMAANASGVRDTSRVLKVSQDKVISTLKKRRNS
jgi:transposase-like protein